MHKNRKQICREERSVCVCVCEYVRSCVYPQLESLIVHCSVWQQSPAVLSVYSGLSSLHSGPAVCGHSPHKYYSVFWVSNHLSQNRLWCHSGSTTDIGSNFTHMRFCMSDQLFTARFGDIYHGRLLTSLFGCYMACATWKCCRLGAFCVTHHSAKHHVTSLYAKPNMQGACVFSCNHATCTCGRMTAIFYTAMCHCA